MLPPSIPVAGKKGIICVFKFHQRDTSTKLWSCIWSPARLEVLSFKKRQQTKCIHTLSDGYKWPYTLFQIRGCWLSLMPWSMPFTPSSITIIKGICFAHYSLHGKQHPASCTPAAFTLEKLQNRAQHGGKSMLNMDPSNPMTNRLDLGSTDKELQMLGACIEYKVLE